MRKLILRLPRSTKDSKQEFDTIAGVDEAGRGALAGPVISACIVLPKNYDTKELNDSKKLSATKRYKLYRELISITPHIGIGIRTANQIDLSNILKETLNSMADAINQITLPTETIFVDGNKKPVVNNKNIETLIKGDALLPCISAASIIAKVTRDQIMSTLHEKYPHYNFLSNKGYGTKNHYETIFEHGITPYHRKSFNLSVQGTLFHV